MDEKLDCIGMLFGNMQKQSVVGIEWLNSLTVLVCCLKTFKTHTLLVAEWSKCVTVLACC